MSLPVFLVDTLPGGVGDTLILDGPEGRHAAAVRRVRPGEEILLADGRGIRAQATVTEVIDRGAVALQLDRIDRVPAPTPLVTVVQGIPKGEHGELAVDLATQAGADGFIIWEAPRSVARWTGAKQEKGRTRWEAAAREAAKQSRRAWVPPVAGPLDTRALVGRVAAWRDEGALVLVLHEESARPLTEMRWEVPQVVLIVGPEGGIGPEELDQLTAAGAQPVVLGPQVLRASAAAAVALGALGVLTGRWSAG